MQTSVRPKSTTRLRELLKTGRTLVKPGAFDPLSAMIIEKAGFPCVGVTGYSVSAALLGKPDVGLLTLNEIVMMARYTARAVSIPVLADADTGFGNAINVMRTVEDFIVAGVAGIHIEDQVAPKRCGHVAGKQVVPMEEMIGKLRAADRVRRELDPDFLLIARCDARGVAGGTMDELIRRSNAYMDAGADMIFPEAITSEAELERCAREIRGPITFNRTGVSPRVSLDRLNELGIAMVANATGALRSAIVAMHDYFEAFAQDDVEHVKRFEARYKDHPAGNLHAYIGFPRIRELEQEFLPAAEVLAKYEGSVGFQP
ncbi:MAG TPA: isocitrate lyase/PEP mutase family protein [Burkholderiales bacterium]|nr:isocitrate lyase/PEP mutase family protein [Burkholderiales bacterium]